MSLSTNSRIVQSGRYSPPREGINVLDESEIEADESCVGEEIPLLAEEAWLRHQ